MLLTPPARSMSRMLVAVECSFIGCSKLPAKQNKRSGFAPGSSSATEVVRRCRRKLCVAVMMSSSPFAGWVAGWTEVHDKGKGVAATLILT
ncbi:unnamed protein product [Citrullus colocynthis]|uniref:Secreted protein n=1 Tax=Citrullus colocynthis TaxID=252529 RepID=A0ABP0ZB81_9ROSI